MQRDNVDIAKIAEKISEINGFQLLDSIASGGFKHTFKVRNKTGKFFALKIYLPMGNTERMQREIKSMQKCDNPFIAEILTHNSLLYEDQEYYFIIEDFFAGGTLQQYQIKNGIVGEIGTYELGVKLIEALRCIKENNLVHRDIKPQNILLRDNSLVYPVITDFGIVRMLDETSITDTFLPGGPGTLGYAAPEQVNNDKEIIDWRTDQFSLGVVLSICAFGFHPFGNNCIDVIANRGPLSKEFLSSIEGSNLRVLKKMLGIWPSLRYPTPNDLLIDWKNQREE